MAVYTLKKTSDIEKRLKTLRQQIYGRDQFRDQNSEIRDKKETATNYEPRTTNLTSDITYLYNDLFKIGLFSCLAIGSQLVLFFLLQNHVINLNF